MGGKTQSVPSTTTQVSRTEIPDFLMPLLQAQVGTGVSALNGLQSSLSGGLPNQQVAGFSPMQLQSQQMLQRAIENPNGVYQSSLDGLKNLGQGWWVNHMAPTLNAGIEQAINGEFIPGSATNTLDSFSMNGYQLPGASQSALEQSASGANLYGTPAFNEAVQASIRAAQPGIASTFAGAGSGGLKSGLAQVGMQQAASDAFARLYGDERNRQLSSAVQLGSFGLAGRDQQLNAAAQRGNLAVNEQGLRNQATLGLGSLMSQERQRQLQALQSAPGIGLMGINAMNSMGGQQQAQTQAELDAQRMNEMNPILAQQMMLAASQGIPISSLMGQSSTGTANNTMYRNTGAGILGGAATGAGIGSALGLAGGPLGWAALAGGLLGGYL